MTGIPPMQPLQGVQLMLLDPVVAHVLHQADKQYSTSPLHRRCCSCCGYAGQSFSMLRGLAALPQLLQAAEHASASCAGM